MFGSKKQSMDASGAIFQANVVRSKDRRVIQKGTLETTPTSVVFRADGSKTKLSWSLKSLRKIEAISEKLFMMDTGDVTCGLSEEGVIWFQMSNAKQLQNAVLHHMNVMIKSETPQNHRSMTSATLPDLQQPATPTSVFDEASPSPPPVHWRLNTRTSMESTNSSTNVSPTNSRASLVQRDIFEVEKILGKEKRERGTLEVLDNEVIYVESESGEWRRVVWSFKYIRRFGYEGDVFTLEVGRKAPGGAGLHNFKTSQPAELNASVKASSMSGGGTPPSPSPHGRSSYTPPSQRPVFSPPSASHHPPPYHAAPLPPPPSQPPLHFPPSPPETPRNPQSSHHVSPKLSKEAKPRVTSTGGFSRSDSLIRRAFSAADLRPNVFDVRNISDDKKEVGQGTLEVTATDLIYIDARTNEKWRWPFKFLRKYGFEKSIFSFEAGRRCPGGQGLYAFSSDRAGEIHEMIVSNIRGKKKEEEPRSSSRMSNNSESSVAKTVPKSHSRYSFTEDQSAPSSLVKLTNKNHYNIDTGLHALMQSRPLPAEPGEEGELLPSPPSAADSTTSCPSKSSTASSSSERDSKIISPTPSLPAVSESPASIPTSPPANYAQVVPPMQLVKPVMDQVRPQPLVREHHYDVPGNYGADVKPGKKLKKQDSSGQMVKKADSPRASEKTSKKRLSKGNIKPDKGNKEERTVTSPQNISVKDSKSHSKFRSFLKKKKPKEEESSRNCAAVGDVDSTDGAEPQQLYVNVSIGSLKRMKKSASCDDILASCELEDAHKDTPSAVPLPQLTSSQTPPAQKRPGNNGYHYQSNQQRNSDLVSSAAALVYQNLQDIKARGKKDHTHPAPPTSNADLTADASPSAHQPHLYSNVQIRSETEALLTPKGTLYTEIEIQQVSPTSSKKESKKSSQNCGIASGNMHPLLQQIVLPRLSPEKSAKRGRSQSLIPFLSQDDSTGAVDNQHRDRPQSEITTEEKLNQAAEMTTAVGVAQEPSSDPKFEPVQYAPLDFNAMRAVAAMKRDDVKTFEEVLQRHDVRQMEMEGKRR